METEPVQDNLRANLDENADLPVAWLKVLLEKDEKPVAPETVTQKIKEAPLLLTKISEEDT